MQNIILSGWLSYEGIDRVFDILKIEDILVARTFVPRIVHGTILLAESFPADTKQKLQSAGFVVVD